MYNQPFISILAVTTTQNITHGKTLGKTVIYIQKLEESEGVELIYTWMCVLRSRESEKCRMSLCNFKR
jgi:hypothetical protein